MEKAKERSATEDNLQDRLCCTKVVNATKEDVAFTYFYLKLDERQNEASGDIILFDSGGKTRIVMFLFMAVSI